MMDPTALFHRPGIDPAGVVTESDICQRFRSPLQRKSDIGKTLVPVIDWKMADVLPTIFAAVLSVAILAGLSRILRRSKPLALSGQRGAIRPERWSAWITVVVGTAMFVWALFVLLFGDGEWGAAVAALIGAAIAGFMASSVTSVHAVYWNNEGMEGPSKTFGPTLGLARVSIKWDEIVASGATFTGYWYVEARDGRRIYWSYLYKGYGSLTRALLRHCPSVQPPSDMG